MDVGHHLQLQADALASDGRLVDAAEVWLTAARSELGSARDRAGWMHKAARGFQAAGSQHRQSATAFDAVALWTKLASSGHGPGEGDCLWNALLSSVTVQDVAAQVALAVQLVEVSSASLPLTARIETLRRYVLALPAKRADEARAILGVALADAYCDQASSQGRSESISTLRSAVAFYDLVSPCRAVESRLTLVEALTNAIVIEAESEPDHARAMELTLAVSRVRDASVDRIPSRLKEALAREAHRIENEPGESAGLLRRARAHEAAADLFDEFSTRQARRSRRVAARLRRRAEHVARQPVATHLASRRLDAALELIARPASARQASSKFFGPSLRSEGVYLQSDTVSAARTEGTFSFDIPDSVISVLDVLVGDLADPLGIDEVADQLLFSIVMEVGETTSYCPTPYSCPIFIVTTTWPKSLLALVAAGLAGGVAGAASGGGGTRAAVMGALGAETGILINLLSTYLTQPTEGRKELAGLLEAYSDDSVKLGVVLQLRANSSTAPAIATQLGLSTTQVRRTLAALENDGSVIRDGKGSRGAWVWKIVEGGRRTDSKLESAQSTLLFKRRRVSHKGD